MTMGLSEMSDMYFLPLTYFGIKAKPKGVYY